MKKRNIYLASINLPTTVKHCHNNIYYRQKFTGNASDNSNSRKMHENDWNQQNQLGLRMKDAPKNKGKRKNFISAVNVIKTP